MSFFCSSLQHQFSVASADREKKILFSISAGRIEMSALRCIVVGTVWYSIFFFICRVLRLSRILSASFLSFQFFFILENFVHLVYRSIDSVRIMRHAICNGFERKKFIYLRQKSIYRYTIGGEKTKYPNSYRGLNPFSNATIYTQSLYAVKV